MNLTNSVVPITGGSRSIGRAIAKTLTDAGARVPQNVNESKLRGAEIAVMVKAVLEMDDRGFVPEMTVFVTNPVD